MLAEGDPPDWGAGAGGTTTTGRGAIITGAAAAGAASRAARAGVGVAGAGAPVSAVSADFVEFLVVRRMRKPHGPGRHTSDGCAGTGQTVKVGDLRTRGD